MSYTSEQNQLRRAVWQTKGWMLGNRRLHQITVCGDLLNERPFEGPPEFGICADDVGDLWIKNVCGHRRALSRRYASVLESRWLK